MFYFDELWHDFTFYTNVLEPQLQRASFPGLGPVCGLHFDSCWSGSLPPLRTAPVELSGSIGRWRWVTPQSDDPVVSGRRRKSDVDCFIIDEIDNPIWRVLRDLNVTFRAGDLNARRSPANKRLEESWFDDNMWWRYICETVCVLSVLIETLSILIEWHNPYFNGVYVCDKYPE